MGGRHSFRATIPLAAVAHLVPSEALGRGRDSTLRAIVSALKTERGGRRLILGVDDAHLLDDAPAALVPLLARGGTASVVATLRSGEPAPDAIVSLWKDGPAPLIALQTLSRAEVEALLATALDGPVEGSTLHFLWEASAGNALYLREVVLHGRETGALSGCKDCGSGGVPSNRANACTTSSRRAWAPSTTTNAPRWNLSRSVIRSPSSACAGSASTSSRRDWSVAASSCRAARSRRDLAGPSAVRGSRCVTACPPPGATRCTSNWRTRSRRRATARRLSCSASRCGGSRPATAVTRRSSGTRRRRAMESWDPTVAERLARAALDAGPEMEASYILGEALSEQNRAPEALEALRRRDNCRGPTGSVRRPPPARPAC